MAISWTLVFIFGLGLCNMFSNIRTLFRLSTGHHRLNFTETVSQYGYTSQNYTVQTDDGYLLTLYRISNSAKCKRDRRQSPVLLVNGLTASADCFLQPGVDNGLPYLIADACYDVWIGNARGCYDGRRHITLDPDNDRAFWDFSLDEIGKYDVPATIDFVLNHTGEQQLNYIGVSQGAGSFMVACSERPEYSDKVKLFVGLGPASKHTHSKSALFRASVTLLKDYQEMYETLGVSEVLWRGILDPVGLICKYKPEVCNSLIALMDSPHTGSYSTETLKITTESFPAGTSVKNFARYGQSVNSNRFCKFDYGPKKNLQLYGGKPPDFNLSAVTAPTYFLHGKNDGIVDLEDVEWLVSQLPNVKELLVMEDPLWNHMDMVISKYIGSSLFPKVFKYLELYNSNEETTTILNSNKTITTPVVSIASEIRLADHLVEVSN